MIFIPPLFRQKILATYGSKGERWLERLPVLVENYLLKWELEQDGEFDSLSFNFVLPVKTKVNSLAVLKLGPHLKGRVKETKALLSYKGAGAIKVLEFAPADGISLFERAVPGIELKNNFGFGQDQDATEVAAQIIQTLHRRNGANAKDFTHISIWGLGFEKYLRENPEPRIEADLVLKADEIFKNLVRTSSSEILLHGDLHHSNILRSSRDQWLAIDPKGVWGDPSFETGAFLRNPMPELSQRDELPSILHGRIERLAKFLKFDSERIWGWGFSQSILAGIWSLNENDESWRDWIAVARALDEIRTDLPRF